MKSSDKKSNEKINKKHITKNGINKITEKNLLKLKNKKVNKKRYLEELLNNINNDINKINKNLLNICDHEWVPEYDDGPENRKDYICKKCFNYKSYLNNINNI